MRAVWHALSGRLGCVHLRMAGIMAVASPLALRPATALIEDLVDFRAALARPAKATAASRPEVGTAEPCRPVTIQRPGNPLPRVLACPPSRAGSPSCNSVALPGR